VTSPRPLVIATRGSALALWQANRVREALDRTCGVASEILVVKTSGDRFTSAPLEQIGLKGIFTKELEDALIDRRADLAVHSMKDVPTEFSGVCRIATVFRRDDPRDALVSRAGQLLAALPPGARVGTGSLRRSAQLLAVRPDLAMAKIRGNVDTRLRKLDSASYDAIVLAKAGLDRLGFSARITEILPPEAVLPAVGQGALGVEFLAAREDEFRFLDRLVDHETSLAVSAERAVLAELQGGCRLPLGAWARFDKGVMLLDACVLSADGSESIRRSSSGACASAGDAVKLGKRVAGELLEAGADRLLRLAGRVA
jgi:hydroxymethylbilane synthase